MSGYRFAFVLLIVGACLVGIGVVGLRHAPSRPPFPIPRNLPNVVLIVSDALRADRVNGQRNGVPLMPHLSQFGEECVRFTNAVSPCTWTRPSMASIFTSLYGDTLQIYHSSTPQASGGAVADRLSDNLETMATFLSNARYDTKAIQTNGNLVPELGFAQGFGQYEYLAKAPAERVTERALFWLEHLTPPFFFYVHYLEPHPPYTPPEDYRTLLGFPDPQLDPAERKIAEDFMGYFMDHDEYMMGLKPSPSFPPLSPLGEEAVRTLYDGKVRYVDDEMGKLLSALQAKFPNTIFVVLADHGEHFWDHGLLGHGLTLYNEELRVPFFIKAPGLKPRAIDANVSTIDVLPTIAALLGIPASAAWQGRDLFAPRDPLTPTFAYTRAGEPRFKRDVEMVKVGSDKLIYDRASARFELYDVAADPHEKTNLAAQRPEQVQQFKALLDAHRRQNILARGQVQRQSVPLDDEIKQQLRDIGYLEGAGGK